MEEGFITVGKSIGSYSGQTITKEYRDKVYRYDWMFLVCRLVKHDIQRWRGKWNHNYRTGAESQPRRDSVTNIKGKKLLEGVLVSMVTFIVI